MNCKQKLKVKVGGGKLKRFAITLVRIEICDSISIRSLIFHLTKRKTGNSIFFCLHFLLLSHSLNRSSYLEKRRSILCCCHQLLLSFFFFFLFNGFIEREPFEGKSFSLNFQCDFIIYVSST